MQLKITLVYFEGNETELLLKNTSKMREVLDDNVHIFVDCMDSLYQVKKSCFEYTVGETENYKEDIRKIQR